MVNSKLERELSHVEKRLMKTEKSLNEIKILEDTALRRLSRRIPSAFTFHDIIQQLVGAWIVLVPLTHFGEIMETPLRMSWLKLSIHFVSTIILSILILYYTKYREIKWEKIFGIPIRYLSLLTICTVSTLFVTYVYYDAILATDPLRIFMFLFGFAVLGSAAADMIR